MTKKSRFLIHRALVVTALLSLLLMIAGFVVFAFTGDKTGASNVLVDMGTYGNLGTITILVVMLLTGNKE